MNYYFRPVTNIINPSYTTISLEHYIFFNIILKVFSTNIPISLALHIVLMSKNISFTKHFIYLNKKWGTKL